MSEDDYSCMKYIEKTVHIPLSSSKLSNEVSGVLEYLEAWKYHYVRELDGIVVSFNNVSFLNVGGKLIVDQPGIHFDIIARFAIFKPSVGSILKGTINRISREHIGCVVHNSINVSIHLSQNIAADVARFIAIDNCILFHVTNVDRYRRSIRVKGKITSQCLEIMEKLFPQQNTSTHKFFNDDDFHAEQNMSSSGVSDLNQTDSASDHSTKRKKKQKRAEEALARELSYSLADHTSMSSGFSDSYLSTSTKEKSCEPISEMSLDITLSPNRIMQLENTQISNPSPKKKGKKRKREIISDSFNDSQIESNLSFGSIDLSDPKSDCAPPPKKTKKETDNQAFDFLDYIQTTSSKEKYSNTALVKSSSRKSLAKKTNVSVNENVNSAEDGLLDLHLTVSSNASISEMQEKVSSDKTKHKKKNKDSSKVKDKSKSKDKKSKTKDKKRKSKGKFSKKSSDEVSSKKNKSTKGKSKSKGKDKNEHTTKKKQSKDKSKKQKHDSSRSDGKKSSKSVHSEIKKIET